MDKNVYRIELEQLRFTQAGKEALTEALMAEQTAPIGPGGVPGGNGAWPLLWQPCCW